MVLSANDTTCDPIQEETAAVRTLPLRKTQPCKSIPASEGVGTLR